MNKIILKKGRARFLERRHPWVFSNAIERVEGSPKTGEVTDVCSFEGKWLAYGGYSPDSQIRARIWSFDREEKVDDHLIEKRLKAAVLVRREYEGYAPEGACRLVNAESDGFPGLIVDKYAGFLVCQFSSAAAEAMKVTIVDKLAELVPCSGIYERSDVAVRQKEGLKSVTGSLRGEVPPDLLEINEHGHKFLVDVKNGHKTGFYLDQQENRQLVAGYCSGKSVLNCFSYTGGFGIYALKSGARHVVNIDSSSSSLSLSRQIAALNSLDEKRFETVEADAFSRLRKYYEDGEMFDVIMLDPPKFADSRQHVPKAARGYKDINFQAFKLLNPGGLLFTFSCSGQLDEPLFQKIIADAALDAGRQGQILKRMFQSADHPVALGFPEGSYLKGLVCRVL